MTIQSPSGRVAKLDDLRNDKAYLILHAYIEKCTKQVNLQLEDGK